MTFIERMSQWPRPVAAKNCLKRASTHQRNAPKDQFVAQFSSAQRPEELQRGKDKVIIPIVSLPGLAEADESEAPARGSADREVAGHVRRVQVVAVLAAINDLPRSITSGV